MHAYADIIGVNAGKQWMRRRKPVNVKSFSILHNAVMFFASLYMVIETLRQVGRAPVGTPPPISDLIPREELKLTASGCLHKHVLQCMLPYAGLCAQRSTS